MYNRKKIKIINCLSSLFGVANIHFKKLTKKLTPPSKNITEIETLEIPFNTCQSAIT